MNNSPIISGLAVNLVTPFNAQGEIDFPALEKLVRRIRHSDVHCIFINASSSEASMLDQNEQDRVVEFVSEINDNDKMLVGGIPGGSTRSCVQRIASFDQHGLTAIYCDEPLPQASSPSGYIGHFRSIAQSAPLPIIFEHKTGLLGTGAEEAILSLSKEQNIIGMVESTGDVALHGAIIRRKPESFSVMSGRDVMALPLMALGINGAVSTIANAFPMECARMMDQMVFGNFQDARETHHLLAPLLRILESEGSPTGIKSLLNHFQMMDHLVRLPNTPVSDKMRGELYRALAELPQTMVTPALNPA